MMINKISQAMQGELRKVDSSLKADRLHQPVKSGNAGAVDRSEFSTDGKMQREIKGDMQIISSMVKAQPDVRAEKVAEARAKISMGFYNTEAFAAKLADKLAGALA